MQLPASPTLWAHGLLHPGLTPLQPHGLPWAWLKPFIQAVSFVWEICTAGSLIVCGLPDITLSQEPRAKCKPFLIPLTAFIQRKAAAGQLINKQEWPWETHYLGFNATESPAGSVHGIWNQYPLSHLVVQSAKWRMKWLHPSCDQIVTWSTTTTHNSWPHDHSTHTGCYTFPSQHLPLTHIQGIFKNLRKRSLFQCKTSEIQEDQNQETHGKCIL